MHKALIGSMVLALAAGAAQGTVLKFAGFEASEGYVLGDLFGQQGWTDTGNVAEVNNALAATGSRSISIDSSPIFGAAWWWPSVNHDTSTSSEKVVIASVDMFITAGDNSANWGLDCYDENVTRISGLWINDTGNANYWDGTSTIVTSTAVNFNSWNNLKITMDYVSQTNTYAINGVTIGSAAFGAGLTSIMADVDINLQSALFDTAYFDNYKVESTPTPGAIGVLGLGGLLAGRRRR